MTKNIVEPRTLRGFMELLPAEQIVFNRMINIITQNYEKFGFTPIDTPVLEMSEVLLAKAGGETEKQIYGFTKGDTNLTMRFDLTVPLSKYVAKNQNFLTFPFRRYHIGKVWRGENPQKGRFREFYQCDIDIIGDGELSILNDAEIPAVIFHTFKSLGFDNFTIRVNNRKILSGLCQHIGAGENIGEVLKIIDKLEKIGVGKVIRDFENLGLSESSIKTLIDFMAIAGAPNEICSRLKTLGIDNTLYNLGVDELAEVSKYIGNFGIPQSNFKIDLTIARGLDYYTGTVYETVLDDHPELGSICSGGRYDDLAGYFTEKKLPGVGISIGLTRLFYQLNEAGIVKGTVNTPTECVIIPMDMDLSYVIDFATTLRNSGIKTAVYLEKKSMKQKMNFANKQKIPFVVIIGEDEIREKNVTLKDMNSGKQVCISLKDAPSRILEALNNMNRGEQVCISLEDSPSKIIDAVSDTGFDIEILKNTRTIIDDTLKKINSAKQACISIGDVPLGIPGELSDTGTDKEILDSHQNKKRDKCEST